jgi:YVTN family beta-propeller protein
MLSSRRTASGSVSLTQYKMHLKPAIFVVFLLAAITSVMAQDQTRATTVADSSNAPQKFLQEGISLQFEVAPLAGGATRELLEGMEATVHFKIVDANAGKVLSNLRPTAWIDRRDPGKLTDARACREKVQSFLQASFDRRPTIDLNTYFILALNHEPNISVIDPLMGFGGSKLYTLVPLRSSGQDWVISQDKKRMYVSMPAVNQVAVIDTLNWKVVANLDTGNGPARIALQHDGRYLWVGNDGGTENDGGVTVIDTATLKRVAQIVTGNGHHDIAFNADDSSVFVTNKQDGTLSVIDIRKLVRTANVKVGSLPSAIVFSTLSNAVYVANEGDGTITVLNASGRETQRMKTQPGLRALRLAPDERFGFAVNDTTSTVYIFDLASNRVVHAVPVGPGADQIAFTREFAYVRTAGSEFVNMIKIADLGKETALSRFPAGQYAPQRSPARSMADAIVPAPGDGSVLVANPADKMIYFYTEGMAAPMGSFQNYRRDPKALLVLDHSLRETARGDYTTTVRLPAAGRYDVAFLLDSPRLVNCFEMNVTVNPALPKPQSTPIEVEQVTKNENVLAGQNYDFRFRVTDANSHRPRSDIDDLRVLVFLAPGVWQQRPSARKIGDGVYEISFVPPQAGVYYFYFQSTSLGLEYSHTMPLNLRVSKQ